MNHWTCTRGRTLVGGMIGGLVLDARMRRGRGRLSINGPLSGALVGMRLFYFCDLYDHSVKSINLLIFIDCKC